VAEPAAEAAGGIVRGVQAVDPNRAGDLQPLPRQRAMSIFIRIYDAGYRAAQEHPLWAFLGIVAFAYLLLVVIILVLKD
jgi:hypothetical protein